MGRCTAVEILELDADMPSHVDPETALRADQRLPLLEEVWEALTERERRTISDRLAEKQHGVRAAEGCKGAAREIDEILNQLEERSPNWVAKLRAHFNACAK